MNMKMSIVALAAMSALSAAATPTVTTVTFDQELSTRRVTITYQIDEPAVVTVDVQTNRGDGVFVSIGAENLRELTGQVNRLVTQTGVDQVVNWQPDLYWNQGHKIVGANVKAVVTAWATNAPPDWLVLNLSSNPVEARYYVSTNAIPFNITDTVAKTEKLVMRRIHAADVEWRMGSPATEPYRNASEYPRTVYLTQDYYIGIYEFTLGQYKNIWQTQTPPSGASSGSDSYPLNGQNACYNKIRGTSDNVDWPNTVPAHKVAAGSYLDTIRNRVGFEMDLPTEAQWEFACRAGTTTGFNNGQECDATGGSAVSPILDELGWYPANADGGVHEVGLKKPNAWLIYDCHGNTLEWCLDWCDESVDISAYGGADPVGLTGVASPVDGTSGRVLKGGGYVSYGPNNCRSAFREAVRPSVAYSNYGFRLVCPPIAVR